MNLPPLHHIPGPDALPPYYHEYLTHAQDVTGILAALEGQAESMTRMLDGLTAAQENHRYAPGKWSVREVLGHLVDTERVFQLRALWFARTDPQPLPGYDENLWAAASNAGDLPMERLLAEYHAVRRSSLALWGNMSEDLLLRAGEASGRRFQVGAIPWFLLGHERHHQGILRDRYGL
ncbi:MAG TPA: DinB family protein [Longimicrobiales bacterium]|nr:DinB family protein [Longimicrobiales bacterium]